MGRKQYLMIIVFTLAGGIIGGVISNQILPGLAAFAKESPHKPLVTIGAEKFVVTDADGNIRAVFGMIDDEPSLMMFGRKNSLPKMLVFDSENCRAELGLTLNGDASLNFFNQKGELSTAIGAVRVKLSKTGEIKNLSSAIIFFDEKGKVVWSAPKSIE